MRIQKINLQNFRGFKRKKIGFSEKITIIVGPNAAGKSNIIESIFLLSTGKSFRARIEEEMVSYDEEIARVKGVVENGGIRRVRESGTATEKDTTNLEVVLTRGEITVGESPERTEKVARKRLLVNGVGKRLVDFAGIFKAVLFGPWDLGLVTESPSVRRRFLDTVLSQVDREYRRASLSYEKGLRQRNKLLYRIREEGISRSQLIFWNKLLIKNGDYISKLRQEFIEFTNFQEAFDDRHGFSLEYDRSAISESRLEQYAGEEVAAATTLVGPHRDDFIFRVKEQESKRAGERELARYGSRGEQRMGVLWLKMAELAYIEEKSEEKPTLLLDDIFSELDVEHRRVVLEIASKQQTIITTADPHYLTKGNKSEIIKL